MDEKAFKDRTKKLAVAIIKQMDKLPNSRAADVVADKSFVQGHRLVRITEQRVAQNPRRT